MKTLSTRLLAILCMFFSLQADLGITELNVSLSGGSTKKGFGVTNENTTVLNYNGPLSFAPVFKGVPVPALTPAQTALVNNLSAVPETATFGYLKPTGKYSFFQCGLTLRQTVQNWFISITVPYKKIKISDITYIDLGTPAEQQIPAWVAFKENLDELLAAYGVKMTPYTISGLNDISIQLGKNIFFSPRHVFKELSGSVRGGFIVPCGKKAARNRVFALPLGNDGQVGVPLSFSMDGKVHDVLGISFSSSFIFFIDQITSWRMKTSLNQNMVYLALGAANRKMQPFANVSVALNAQPGPFSLSLGYAYTYIGDVLLYPEDTDVFTASLVNTAEMLTSSFLQSVTLSVGYQSSIDKNPIIPETSLFVSVPFSGNTIFNLPLAEASLGFQFIWSF